MEKNFIKRIVVDPKIMVGKPIIRGTKVTVYEIINRVAQGQTFRKITKDLDTTIDDIKAVLAYTGDYYG